MTGFGFDGIKKLAALVLALITAAAGLINPVLAPFVPDPEQEPPAYTGAVLSLTGTGADKYVIVTAAGCCETDMTAADILRENLFKISGQTLEIVSDSTPEKAKEILIGTTNREGGTFTVDRSWLNNEGYLIKTFGEKLVISGLGNRGTIYGVYGFLEDVLGCRWYTKDLAVLPSANEIKIPADTNISKNPYFELRETDWISPHDKTYSLANNINGDIYRQFSAAQGGNVKYLSSFAHTLTMQFAQPSKYFAAHPEYYAYREDQSARVPAQLCLSNPEVLNVVISEVLELLSEKYPAASSDIQLVSITQAVHQNYCQCPACKAIDKDEGSSSGAMIRFVNAVADAVKTAGYNKAAVETFAYQYTQAVPKHAVPKENVIVRLCSIDCCYSHPMDTALLCTRNSTFMNDLRNWSKLSSRLYIWDYTVNCSHLLGPFPDFGVIQRNLQVFAENGVKGVYEQGNPFAADADTEFAELRAYLLAKLMWNPYLDYDAEMNGFLEAYYGKGWQYIREYINMMTKNTGTLNRHMSIWSDMSYRAVLAFSSNEVRYCNDLWAKAKELAGTGWQTENVTRSELSWRYWKACNWASEFSRLQLPRVWINENKKLYSDLKAFGVNGFNVSYNLTDNPDFCKTPAAWAGASVFS